MNTIDAIFVFVGAAIAVGCVINIVYSIVMFRKRNINDYIQERNHRKKVFINGKKKQ